MSAHKSDFFIGIISITSMTAFKFWCYNRFRHYVNAQQCMTWYQASITRYLPLDITVDPDYWLQRNFHSRFSSVLIFDSPRKSLACRVSIIPTFTRPKTQEQPFNLKSLTVKHVFSEVTVHVDQIIGYGGTLTFHSRFSPVLSFDSCRRFVFLKFTKQEMIEANARM